MSNLINMALSTIIKKYAEERKGLQLIANPFKNGMAGGRKVYISGAISDNTDTAQEEFDLAETSLIHHGARPISPMDVDLHIENSKYTDFMKVDIRLLVDCHFILMLDGWEDSFGACVELLVAIVCGIEVLTQGDLNG